MNEQYAKEILVHHIRRAVQNSGGNWDNDCAVEIEEAVDLIIRAAVRAAIAAMQKEAA